MAYFTQDMKKSVAAELKKIMPKGWKYSLSIDGYSKVLLTISKAPVDLMALINQHNKAEAEWKGFPYHEVKDHVQLNTYSLSNPFKTDPAMVELFDKIKEALRSAGWYDRSDSSRDHHDVAYYIGVHIGKWNKAFEFVVE